ncbi:MAG: protein-L-isoaspartate O-methyltransferase [Geminicoccaceae bacterium]|nr:protein-L-isoaspartate O-methyltransferase [Geminicoccaceae bacterium]
MSEFAQARHNMVENQLRPSQIDAPALLDAMEAVPRELFLPKRLRPVAYQDEDIDLGNGRHLIEPLALAKMLQSAGARRDEVALVIGCHTGYCAAVLSKLVATVFHLGADDDEARGIETLLAELGCDNVVVQGQSTTAAEEGLPEQAPFGLILLAGSVTAPPKALLEQLEEEGRLVCVVEAAGDGRMRGGKVTVVRRYGDAFGTRAPFDAAIPPLRSLRPAPGFVF